MRKTMSDLHTRAKGVIGEDVACKYLIGKGFKLEKRNYQKAWGEIDIIALKDNTIHFFEVKSVTADFSAYNNNHRPEENVHNLKVSHIRRMVKTYLEESKRGMEADFQFHVLCVYMDMNKRVARIRLLENLII
ncbi:MAG: YraN family protein [Candidatus Paceibacterota bacterium]|jgi:putative endonuclease